MINDHFTMRFVIGLLIFLVGFVSGIYVHFSTVLDLNIEDQYIKKGPTKPQKIIQTEEYGEIKVPDVEIKEMSGKKINIVSFKDGYKSSHLTADAMFWNKDGPVKFSNPVLYELDSERKSLMTKISGSSGKISINTTTKELEELEINGNVKMFRLVEDKSAKEDKTKVEVKKEPKEEPKTEEENNE